MPKVLIVEDDPLNLRLFNDLLTNQDCDVITSKDGVGVHKMVKEHMPELILMDIQLRGLSGVDLIKELKQDDNLKHIPIIAVTAFAMKNDEAYISTSGCDMYVSKPVHIDAFYKAVSNFITLANFEVK